jgi:HlyD family secretion protein
MRYLILILIPFLFACEKNENLADAYGNFETDELIISSEANGKLVQFSVEQGQWLEEGAQIGLVDTLPLYLKKQQLLATISAVRSKRQNLSSQEKVYLEQKANMEREKSRLEKLLADGAATPKQLDDVNGQIAVVEKQMQAHLRRLADANRGIESEIPPLLAQIEIIEDQLKRCRIHNPRSGRVLTTFVRESEMAGMGRPLYKLADTREMNLRVYVSGNQLPELKIGQEVKVSVDTPSDSLRNVSGKISWISDEAEFTPKVIQTREERVNLVYALKVKVPNPDGRLKIGMPAEVYFQ